MLILRKPPTRLRGYFSYGEEKAVEKLAEYLPNRLSILEIGTYFGKGAYHTLSHLEDRLIKLNLVNKKFGVTEENIYDTIGNKSMAPYIFSGPNGTINTKFFYGDLGYMPEPTKEECEEVLNYIATPKEVYDILKSLFDIPFDYDDSEEPIKYANDTNVVLFHIHHNWQRYIEEALQIARKNGCYFTFRHSMKELLQYINPNELEVQQTLYCDEWTNYCLVKFR